MDNRAAVGEEEDRKEDDGLRGAVMKQTNWEFNYWAAMDSGCADDGGKIAAILKWDRAEAAAQNQTQQLFLPQQGPILLEKLAKKKS